MTTVTHDVYHLAEEASMGPFRKAAAPSVVIAAMSLLAACGGEGNAGTPAGDTPAEESPLTYAEADRTEYLKECAADEDSITWYTSLAGDVVDDMVEGFGEEYPDLHVDVFRGEQTDIVSRVVQEKQAGRLQGDVVELTSDGFRVLADMGAMAPFHSPALEDYDERFRITNDEGDILGVGDRASYVGFAYNTNSLDKDEVPSQLKDLLDPTLKGKLAITSSTTGVRFVGNALEKFGEQDGEEFLRQFAEQGIRVEAISGSALAGLIGTGEVASSPGIFRNHAEQLQGEGQPIQWVPLEPVTANVGYAGAFADATSPCSAALFLDFELGEKGTAIYEELQYPRPSKDLGFETWVPDETFESTDAYSEAFDRWSALFDELFTR
jgi:iron(III) transport system substrate-binding protein